MESPLVTPTTSITRHRPFTQTQVRADNNHPTALLLTTYNSHSLIGLPRELRDEILWLAVQDDADSGRDAEAGAYISTKSDHKSSHPSLARCSCRSGGHLLVSDKIPLQYIQPDQE